MRFFNFGNKLNSGGLVSGLYGAQNNTFYFLLTQYISPQASCNNYIWIIQMSSPSLNKWGSFILFIYALVALSYDNMLLLRLSHIDFYLYTKDSLSLIHI